MALRVGLTGNIGSGKSQAASFFEDYGASITDADHIVHQLLDQPSQAIQSFALTHMGPQALNEDGCINRTHVRHCILKQPSVRQAWEALLQPAILKALQHPPPTTTYHVLVIPLLFEHNLSHLVDRTCLITTAYHHLYPRLSARDHWPDAHINAILKLQMPPEQQRLMADDTINNDGTLDALQQAVHTLHLHYLSLS